MEAFPAMGWLQQPSIWPALSNPACCGHFRVCVCGATAIQASHGALQRMG